MQSAVDARSRSPMSLNVVDLVAFVSLAIVIIDVCVVILVIHDCHY